MMRSAPVLPFLLFAVAACGGSGEPAPQAEEAAFWPQPAAGAVPKVLLIGIDGVRVDVLREVPTPNLDLLAANGSFSEVAQNVLPTISGPCWSSMLIGVGPDKHGVLNNDFSTNRYADFPDFLTRIEMERPALKTFAAVDWLPLAAENDGGPLITDRIDEKFIIDGYETGWPEGDSLDVEATLEELRTGDSDALFVYLGAPDVLSHDSHGLGPEYRDGIAAADRFVGRMVEAVKGRTTYHGEDWLILVATDHGRTAEGGHGGDSPEETTIFFLASGPSTLVGTPASPPSIMDLPVTALVHLGIQIDPGWGLDGRAVGLKR